MENINNYLYLNIMENKYLYLCLFIFSFFVIFIFIYNKNNQESEIIIDEAKAKLNDIHSKIILIHGSLEEEYDEQLLSVKYIIPTDIVLEIGGNYGRNSCTIASILNDSSNLLVIESDPDNSIKLKENRNNNNLNFLIEDSAISNINLYQKYRTTKPIDEINDIEKWKQINTKTWDEIKNKYNMNFNTLVVDCQGALYYIIKENPDFVESFDKIIIENDFNDIEHKKFVDNNFKKYNFKKIYYEGPERYYYEDIIDIKGRPISVKSTSFFYEVWIKFNN
jgi:FkbM family methyltransferase